MGSTRSVASILLIICLSQSIAAYCQSDPRVTLSEKNAPLQKVLNIIRKQTGFTYFGDASWPQMAGKVTISVTNAPLREVLDICFKNQPLTYEVLDNAISIQVKGQQVWLLKGTVSNAKKEPVPHATILSKGSKVASAVSDDNGRFNILLSDKDTSLVVSSVSYEPREIRVTGMKDVYVELKERISELAGASVVAHTGYQDVPKDRATGSFTQLNTELIGRRVSTSVLDRLDGVTSGLIFNKNNVTSTNQSAITIRGRSTIFANPDPLIVVDNFPYSGDINNINPDDVESITVLKDAAAASIWGAFSGNGVIVITTKKGKYGQKPKWGFNTSATVGEKPDQYYPPILSSKDYIQVEQYLFGQHYYDQLENNLQHPVLSPVVEILIAQRDGKISADDAMDQINALKGQDTRRDVNKYYYRPSFNQQYSLNFSGGSSQDRYYISAGYNKDLSNLVRNQYNRTTLNASNVWSVLPKKIELSTDFGFTASTTYNNNSGRSNVAYPYVRLVDDHGNAVAVPHVLRQSYTDTVGGGQLLDWSYRPLDELHDADDKITLSDARFNVGVKYTFLQGLNAQLYYQYEHGKSDENFFQSLGTFYTRDLINRFSQPGPNGTISRPIPLGGILDETINKFDANNVRLQLNYDHHFDPDNLLVMLAGTEMRDVEGNVGVNRLYGYDPSTHTSMPVNYSTTYPQYFPPGSGGRIPQENQQYGTSDRFLSYYANASYTYRQRYILSGSARRDESNLFGVNANQKGVPLWSVGGAWEISGESFYLWKGWLPLLKLRVTDGYNGNVDRSVFAYTTANLSPYPNDYGSLISAITNPPNPDLRWERINTFNTGLDFSLRNSRVEGSLEYYIKSGKDLIGLTPVDPTTGVLSFTGNTANMVTHGADITLHTKNITGPFKWNTDFLFSYVKDKLTRYAVKFPSVDAYITSTNVSPIVGKPLYSVFALKWMGLDPNTGNPQGLRNGHADTAYSTIVGFPTDSLLYKGAANPVFFGSFRNTFSWRQFEFSFNIIFKFGYYFRRNSINYFNLFTGASPGHPDYEKRWQKPGDEKYTNVPSLVYPPNAKRDEFYSFSEVLIDRGDHIRLQDIQFSYDLPKRSFLKLPVQAIRFYLYANNIGILWRANHQGIDPDYINSIPNPRTLALGCKLDF